MNPEFSGRPFAVGSLFGVRSFRVTKEGVLTGVVHREPWASGVNEAICRSASTAIASLSATLKQLSMTSEQATWNLTEVMCRGMGKVNLRKKPKPRPQPLTLDAQPHQAGTLDCTCGFYAYFDEGHNPHHTLGGVIGIVEGFGVCTTGTRGFRSSKAQLRALVFDETFRHYYPQGVGRRMAKAVQARYPDVPIFWSVEAALAEFPLTPVEGARKPPEPWPSVIGPNFSYTINVDMSGVSKAFADLLRGLPKPPKPQDERSRWERVMQARRERNTGPVRDVRLDRGMR